MGMSGADLGQMQVLENALKTEGQSVNELMGRIDRVLGDTQWTGPAADRFRQEWTQDFRKALTTLSNALGENAQAVRNRSEAIRAASG